MSAPEIFTAAAALLAILAAAYAVIQQRRHPIILDAEQLEIRVNQLQDRIRQLEQQRDNLEHSFQRQVATLVAQLAENRQELEETRKELAMALDELNRLRGVMHQRKTSDRRAVRILGLWPDTDGPALIVEDDALANMSNYTTQIGTVTRRSVVLELSRAMRDGDPYLVLHIGSHGKETDASQGQAGGVLLSGGDLVPPAWWAKVCKEYQIRLVVALVCEGGDLADALRRAGVTAVITSQDALSDTAAAAYAFGLYENMAGGLSLTQSHQIAQWTLPNGDASQIRLHGEDPWGNGQ